MFESSINRDHNRNFFLLIQIIFFIKKEVEGLSVGQQKINNVVRRFSYLIEKNKDGQAYSDFKEGINEGLEIAKDTFEENVEKFDFSCSDGDREARIQRLQNLFNLFIDTIEITKKPNYSRDQLEGIYKGFEKSKKLFNEFIKELI